MIIMLAENFKNIVKRTLPNYDFSLIDEDVKKWGALM